MDAILAVKMNSCQIGEPPQTWDYDQTPLGHTWNLIAQQTEWQLFVKFDELMHWCHDKVTRCVAAQKNVAWTTLEFGLSAPQCVHLAFKPALKAFHYWVGWRRMDVNAKQGWSKKSFLSVLCWNLEECLERFQWETCTWYHCKLHMCHLPMELFPALQPKIKAETHLPNSS